MRRTVTNLLLFVSLTGFCLPWLQAQVTAPACCRRNGGHHCATPATQDDYRAAAAACPYRQATPLMSRAASALPLLAQTLAIGLSAQHSLSYSAPKLIHSYSETLSGRDPPSLV